MYVTFSKEIENIPFIESFLNEKISFYYKDISLSSIKGVLGWGAKKSAKKARNFAKKNDLTYISLEDGFICSYGLRVDGYPPLSLIIDPIGIYYDATKPSFLENLLNQKNSDRNALIEAEKALNLVIQHNISKFNYQPNSDASILKGKKQKRVLVVDQTFNDLSVVYSMAYKETFLNMFNSAIKENPDADIYVKIHPDVLCGKKRGYLSEIVIEKDNIYCIKEDVNSLCLLKYFDKVYTVSSQMGFEALLLGKPVICFGMPFYAGWGLTEDKLKCSRRNQKVDLIELFHKAYMVYCKYINPVTGGKGNIFDVIYYILKQREIAEKIGSKDYCCVDFHFARKKFIKPFLKTHKNKVFFIKSSSLYRFSLQKNTVLVTWGGEDRKKVLNIVKGKAPVYAIEDGFIRSVGLGSEFIPPMSIVIDKRGIYYDPTGESELEYILNNYNFSKTEIERAKKIRNLIVENNITKYNIEEFKSILKPPMTKKIILVPGQVVDDEAVIFGSENIRNNLSLIETVRSKNPDAFIIYKPHPDVLSKCRKNDSDFKKIKKLIDYLETEANIISCINLADEIHTLTSLSGFDALIRNKKVFTYGKAFYAGWGLTEDQLFFPTRKRKLTIYELITGVLIIYPIYYDWKLKGFTDCETIINRIITDGGRFKNIKNNFPKFFKKLLNYINFLKWCANK